MACLIYLRWEKVKVGQTTELASCRHTDIEENSKRQSRGGGKSTHPLSDRGKRGKISLKRKIQTDIVLPTKDFDGITAR